MKEIAVAVVGYGFAGRSFHSYLVSITPGLRLAGIASRSEATRARIVAERGCRAYSSFEEVIADPSVDLVVLATPNSTHADLAVRALDAGKHVVTDKVMCLTVDDADRMIAAAGRTGLFLSVFQNRRWDGDFLTLQKIRSEGLLGDLRWMEMAWQGFGPPSGWRAQAAMGGGRYYDLGAHLVDQVVVLFPEPVELVYCRMHHDFPDADVESSALMVITFLSGRTAVVDTSSLNAVPKPRFYACGTEGTFLKYGVDPQEAAMIAGNIDAAVEAPSQYGRLKRKGEPETSIPTIPGRWRTYYENVRDVLWGVAEPLVRLDEVRRAIGILDAGVRSARTGQVVRPV